MALRENHKDMVKLLIKKGADVNAADNDGETPLFIAVYRDKDIVELLIGKGADVNASNKYGETPLDEISNNKEKGEVKDMLVKYGGKPGKKQEGK